MKSFDAKSTFICRLLDKYKSKEFLRISSSIEMNEKDIAMETLLSLLIDSELQEIIVWFGIGSKSRRVTDSQWIKEKRMNGERITTERDKQLFGKNVEEWGGSNIIIKSSWKSDSI